MEKGGNYAAAMDVQLMLVKGVCIRLERRPNDAAATDAQIKSSMEECASGMETQAMQWDALNMFRKQYLCMSHGAKEVCSTVGCTNQAVGNGGLC